MTREEKKHVQDALKKMERRCETIERRHNEATLSARSRPKQKRFNYKASIYVIIGFIIGVVASTFDNQALYEQGYAQATKDISNGDD